ncbi:MAG: hypothetical protein J5679_01450 [Alphaproteobacteria bacterium]|nr:hypothetical protein [Alphaproteobacteria bacterium]
MGDSKVTVRKNPQNGQQYKYRTPAKKLNPFVKAQLMTALARNDISVEYQSGTGTDTYTVKDADNKTLFVCTNAWDYGYYAINLGGVNVAETDWFENDNHTNDDQQAIFDVIDAAYKKYKQQEFIKESEKSLTPQEAQALKVLNKQK